jgi:hypothetical protein
MKQRVGIDLAMRVGKLCSLLIAESIKPSKKGRMKKDSDTLKEIFGKVSDTSSALCRPGEPPR